MSRINSRGAFRPIGRAASAAAMLLLAASSAGAATEVPFPTAEAALEVAPRERVWDGTVEAVNRATVSAQTSGRVAEILYDVNDYVEAGATIMRFTAVEQQASLRQAQAALEEAEARFEEARQEYERVANMYRNETVSRARFEQAQANRDAAEARLAAARSGVAAAEEQLEYTEVRAPYAGIVSARHVEVGELVSPGQPLMSGLSLQSLRVNVDVPQSMFDPIREIGRASVYVDGNERVAAESLTFFPVADPVSNTFRVRVNLPDGAATLFPGMFVKVGFVVGETRRLLVPAEAVVRRSELTAVYVVADDGVTLRQVRLGRRYGGDVEVLAGLDAGESVALDPVAAGIYVKERQQAAADGAADER
ncbi:MAG: efflux RND transporter periplasmic adaptor subunit [Gammaproteobacteria bacterium]|nr:efflux RND transporter periplasmic adaptor subunit [Gammaproteobacteria bacterium]